MKANKDIRDKAKAYGVYLYEIARKFGVSDAYFSRWLRKEFTAEKKEQALQYIEEISASRKPTTDIFRWVNNKVEKPDMKDNENGEKESAICIIYNDYNSYDLAFCVYDPNAKLFTKTVSGEFLWCTNDGEVLDDSAVKAWAYIPEWRES